MPHIEIKCFPGRSEEQKALCAEKVAQAAAEVAQAAAEALGCKLSSVSVAIKEVEQADWKPQVWDKQIVPDADCLYKKPEYKC